MAADALNNLFKKILAKINALHAAKRNGQKKLDDLRKKYGDKKARFLEFIGEIIMILGLIEGFTREVNNFLGKGKKYEPKLKRILLDCFNSNIACNLDDTFKLPDIINPYFSINIVKFDFFGLLKIDPNALSGQVFYGTPTENTLNRLIKKAIDTNTRQDWSGNLSHVILSVEFNQSTNYVTFYVPSHYLGKPVSSLVNDIINQINLIPNVSLLLNLFDNLYGSFSFSLQPQKIDPLSLFNRQMLDKYIEKILDGGEDLVIDDSFFSFANEELFDMEKMTQNLSKNLLEIVSCNNAESVVMPEDLYPILNQIISAGTFNEQVSVIEAGMSKLETIASRNVTRIDLPKFKIEFYLNLFKQLSSVLTGFVYSPQFLTLMFVYFRLADPNTASGTPIVYDDFKDFLKKTKNILKCIVWSIFKLLLLLIVIPLIIKQLISDANRERYERNKEKYELFVSQYLAVRGLLDVVKNTRFLSEIASSL